MDNSFGEARAKVRTETANFLRRLSGVENLAFDGGQPFANETTLAFLTELTTSDTTIGTQNTSSLPQTKSPDNPSTSILGAELFTQAEQLQASGNLLAALQLLEAAKSDSKAHNIRLRLHELNLLCKAQEKQIAAKLAQDLLAEAETLNILNYDFSLGIDILCAARTAFTLTQNKEQMTLVQEQLCKLCPSKALGFKF